MNKITRVLFPLVILALLISMCAIPAIAAYEDEYIPIGGGKGIMTFDDYSDLKDYEADREVIEWYLNSGVTNGGESFDTFGAGSYIQRHEVAHFMYRFYCIMAEGEANFEDATFGLTYKYADSTQSLRSAGIYLGNGTSALALESITIEEFLTIVYRACNSEKSCTVEGFSVPAGSAADIAGYGDANSVSSWALEAVAGMIKAGNYEPVDGKIDPKANVTRIKAIRVYYALRNTRSAIQAPEGLMALVQTTDPSNYYTGNATASGLNLYVTADDHSAAVAYNGANVNLTNIWMYADSTMTSTLNGDYPRAGLFLANSALLASGTGSVMNVSSSTLSGGSDGGDQIAAATCGGVINLSDLEIYSAGAQTTTVTYGGILTLKDSLVRGYGRFFTTDFFGGTGTFENVTYYETGSTARGDVLCYLDESTTGSFYNCTLAGGVDEGGMGEGEHMGTRIHNGSGIATLTGVASAYFEDCTLSGRFGFITDNRTSMLADISTLTLVNTRLTLYGGSVLEAYRQQKNITTIKDCSITLEDGSYSFYLMGGSYVKLYLDNTIIDGDIYIGDGCTLDVYCSNGAALNGDTVGGGTVNFYN